MMELSQSCFLLVLSCMRDKYLKIIVIIAVGVVSSPVWAESPLSVDEFISQVLKSNLDLRLAESKTSKSKAEASGIRVPSPQIGINQMNMQGGGTAQGWQVSQSIPFPTKVSSDYKARQYGLESEKSNEVAKNQEIKAMARFIYFFVWESQEQERVLAEKEVLLQKHLKIARLVARSDTFAKVHLLKVESELDQVKNDLASVSQIQKERLTMAAQFLDKDPNTYSFKAIDPGLSQAPQIESLENVPQIKTVEKQVKRYEALESERKSEWLPDLNLTYSHMQQTARFPEFNQITVGVSLPFVYFWQPKSFSNQATAQKLSAQIELEKTKRSIQADKVNLEKTIETLKKQISILSESILPRALKRKRVFQNIAPRDLSSLQEHLDTYLSIPNVQLQILSLKSKYEQAVAGLAKYQNSEGGLH